ncbi:MAG: hypothetical protein IPM42_03905 [Saprospiraceae bacterium]|nr:hypothetical protein [Saprospiraceae bacterium]
MKKASFYRIICGGKYVHTSKEQRLVVNYLYDNYAKEVGFLQTSVYAKLAKCSMETAPRDLQDLVSKKMLSAEDSGKKTNYIIVSPKGIRIPKISK